MYLTSALSVDTLDVLLDFRLGLGDALGDTLGEDFGERETCLDVDTRLRMQYGSHTPENRNVCMVHQIKGTIYMYTRDFQVGKTFIQLKSQKLALKRFTILKIHVSVCVIPFKI